MHSIPVACAVACVAVTLVAAVIDARTGRIPNWLTVPPLVAGPVVWGLYGGWWRLDRGSFGGSLLSIAVTSLVPLLLYRRRGMGGGDVKLFAAVGGLALAGVAIEAQFYAFCAGAVLGLGRLAWEGRLLRTLGNTLFLAANPLLPARHRRAIAPELMAKMRFGVAIFLGTAAAVAAHNVRIHHLL